MSEGGSRPSRAGARGHRLARESYPRTLAKHYDRTREEVNQVDEKTAERLMREGKIENYVVSEGRVLVKRDMSEQPGISWPDQEPTQE